MTKERRDRSVSFDRSRASPYPCSSSRSRQSLPKNHLESDENVKEWEEARCPVCMEHPHNALLLLCSSHDKGCHPYMCDTSYRHSNCFDQFRKSLAMATPLSIENSTAGGLVSEPPVEISEGSTSTHPVSEDDVKKKLLCPLCRGHITGWIVVDSARRFMNAKSRSCACETCDFSGAYTDLRKHARLVHPCVRPSEADPERERNWRRMERQRDLGDLISTLQSSIGEERSGEDDSTLAFDDSGWLTFYFFIRVFRRGSSLRSTSWSGTSRARAQVTVRRRSTRLWGETHEVETGPGSRDEDNESSDGGSGSRRPRERIRRRRPTPDNEQ